MLGRLPAMAAFEQHGHTHRLDSPTHVREWDWHRAVWSDPDDPEFSGTVLDCIASTGRRGGGQHAGHGVMIVKGVTTRIVDTRKGDGPVPDPGEATRSRRSAPRVRGAVGRRAPAAAQRPLRDAISAARCSGDFGALVTAGNMATGRGAEWTSTLHEVPPGFKKALETRSTPRSPADRKIHRRVLPREEAMRSDAGSDTQDALPAAGDAGDRVVEIVGLACRPRGHAKKWRRRPQSATEPWVFFWSSGEHGQAEPARTDPAQLTRCCPCTAWT